MDLALTYFDMRGRAEAARLLLWDREIEFVDDRIRSKQEWAELQPTLALGTLPTFFNGEQFISESHTILRFLSRAADLDPSSDNLLVRFDEAHDAIAVAQEELWLSAWLTVDPYTGLQYDQSALPNRLEKLSQLRRDDAGPYWFGREPTRVDYLAFVFLDEIDAFYPQLLESSPSMKSLHEAIAQRANIQSYLWGSFRPAVFGIGKSGPKVDPRKSYRDDEVFECPWIPPIRLIETQ